jgi:hypothetical protein
LYSLDDNGTLVEGTNDLLKHATAYYKDLFGPAPGNMFKLSSNLWSMDETLSVEDNRDLTRPFSEEEMKNAMFAMKTNRAPGPDNIPTEFYQHCWMVVKNDIMNLFIKFHEGNLDVQRLNYGVITLLPKMVDANFINSGPFVC